MIDIAAIKARFEALEPILDKRERRWHCQVSGFRNEIWTFSCVIGPGLDNFNALSCWFATKIFKVKVPIGPT
jgi:hypothetical protein